MCTLTTRSASGKALLWQNQCAEQATRAADCCTELASNSYASCACMHGMATTRRAIVRGAGGVEVRAG